MKSAVTSRLCISSYGLIVNAHTWFDRLPPAETRAKALPSRTPAFRRGRPRTNLCIQNSTVRSRPATSCYTRLVFANAGPFRTRVDGTKRREQRWTRDCANGGLSNSITQHPNNQTSISSFFHGTSAVSPMNTTAGRRTREASVDNLLKMLRARASDRKRRFSGIGGFRDRRFPGIGGFRDRRFPGSAVSGIGGFRDRRFPASATVTPGAFVPGKARWSDFHA